MNTGVTLGLAFIESLDDVALERLAARLAPRLERHMPAPNEDRWLNARDAANYTGMSRTALHKLTAARAIPFEQDGPGCRLWFRRSDLDRWRRGGSDARRSASTPLPRAREAAP